MTTGWFRDTGVHHLQVGRGLFLCELLCHHRTEASNCPKLTKPTPRNLLIELGTAECCKRQSQLNSGKVDHLQKPV
jgi:hypothetical protein